LRTTGAFLSAGSVMPQPFRLILFIVLPLIVIMLVLVYIFKGKHFLMVLLPASLYCRRGIGNIYDRVVYGSVTDFYAY